MQARKVGWIVSIVAIILIFFGLSQFYQTIQADAWAEESVAAQTAYQETVMTKATRIETFVGTEEYKIVYGEDIIGQELIVWLSDKEVHTEYVSDGIQDKELRTMFANKEPKATLMRILPGKLKEAYVWELFYEKPNAAGKNSYYYDYLSFKDGILLDTYNLGTK